MREKKVWPYLWLLTFGGVHFLILTICVLLFLDSEDVFVATSLAVTAGVFFVALRKADERITRMWWVGLFIVGAGSLAFFTVLAFAGPGDAQLCKSSYVYRFRQTIAVGPSPGCLQYAPDA